MAVAARFFYFDGTVLNSTYLSILPTEKGATGATLKGGSEAEELCG